MDDISFIERKIEEIEGKKKKCVDLVLEGMLDTKELAEQKNWYDGQKEKLEKRLLKAKKEKAAEEERKSCFENYKESVDRILNFHGAEDALFRELVDKIVVYQGQMVCVWIKCVPFGIKMRIHSSGKRDNYNTEILEAAIVEDGPEDILEIL